MTVKEISRDQAVYHIVDRTPEQMLRGVAAFIKRQAPRRRNVELSDAIKLPNRIAEIEEYGGIEGNIVSFPDFQQIEERVDPLFEDKNAKPVPRHYMLRYVIKQDITVLIGEDEYRAKTTLKTAERLDELAGRY